MSRNSQNRRPAIPTELVRPVEVRAFDMNAGEIFHPHAHQWGQFTYSAQGVLSVLTEDGRFTAPPAMAVWLPPNVVHDIRPLGSAKFRSLYIAQRLAMDMPKKSAVLSVDPLLRNLILEVAKLPRKWNESGPDSRLIEVLLDRIKCAEPAPLYLSIPSDPRLSAVTNALLDNPGDRRTLEQHSRTAGASARTLARLFLLETGMTFGQWRRQRILMAALEKITQGRSVTSVALEMGYDSPSAFIAMFHNTLGMTPTQYIASRQEPSHTHPI